jgi:hypothetical protein
MQCPQCSAETPAEEWNCVSCRMNVYWASQHYDALTGIRERQGLHPPAETPPFLLRAHVSAMDERADRGGRVEHKVRQIARRVMRGEARADSGTADTSPPAETASGSPASPAEGVEPGWKRPEIESPHLADRPSATTA